MIISYMMQICFVLKQQIKKCYHVNNISPKYSPKKLDIKIPL